MRLKSFLCAAEVLCSETDSLGWWVKFLRKFNHKKKNLSASEDTGEETLSDNSTYSRIQDLPGCGTVSSSACFSGFGDHL